MLTLTAAVYVETSAAVTRTTHRNVSEERIELTLWEWAVRWKYQLREYFYHRTSELIFRSICTGIYTIFTLSTQLIVLYYIIFILTTCTYTHRTQKPAV